MAGTENEEESGVGDQESKTSVPRALRMRDGGLRSPTRRLCYARTLITTRRFCARPSLVLLGAIGFASP